MDYRSIAENSLKNARNTSSNEGASVLAQCSIAAALLSIDDKIGKLGAAVERATTPQLTIDTADHYGKAEQIIEWLEEQEFTANEAENTVYKITAAIAQIHATLANGRKNGSEQEEG